MLKLLALVLFALSVEAQIFPVRAPRWFSSSTAPSSGCTVDADTDKIYIYKQAATTTDYRCRKTGASTFAWVDIASAPGGSGDVQGGTNLTTAGTVPYVSAASTLNQDTAIIRTAAGALQVGKLQIGGATSSFPMIDNSSATLRARLADASGYAVFDAASFLLGGTTKILSGTGSPEGLVTAPVGSIFLRTDGAAGYESYYKGSGSGNTGWSARGNGDYYYPVSYSATPIFQAVAGVGTTFAMTLTGNVTSSTIADASEGKTLTWRICQDATGGRTFAWPTNVVGASTIDSTASACTTQIFVYDGTNAVALTGATVVGGSGANYVLIPGSTSGTLKIQAPAVAGSSVLTFPAGTTDLSATGPGYLKQASAGAAVTVQQKYDVCDMAIGDAAGSALSNAQLGPQRRMCFIPQAATVVEINVAADGGTPNVIVGKRSGGTATDLLSAALATAAAGGIACSKTSAVTCLDGATTASATLQNTSLAAGDYLELVSGTAGGTAKLMTVHVVYTIN